MTKKVLVTGSCGFIGFHVTQKLLNEGYTVVGLDNMNDYYDVNLKYARLDEIKKNHFVSKFTYEKQDLADAEILRKLFAEHNFDIVVNLAAQAGVRYSLTNPQAYLKSNIDGFLNVLECCRHFKIANLIFASSSSVYGNNRKLPFDENDSVDHPISLYAATKKSNELMAHTYAHLFGVPCTGLRFFTVYGPWGRPDMAMFIFAKGILEGLPIKLFNAGEMLRDFTFVDDVVESIVRLCQKSAQVDPSWNALQPVPFSSSAPYKIFNIGNHDPIVVKDVVKKIESFFDKKALIQNEPIQLGDVQATYASTDKLFDYVGFKPKTSIDDGLKRFLNWYKEFYSH